MNHKMNGDITVAFFDAHGDLNTPESSPSKNFHGMPLRTLFGEGEKSIVDLLPSMLLPSQVVMIGTRDCDPAEEDYIRDNNISVITSDRANLNEDSVLEELKAKGCKNIYIHIDADIMDPSEFPFLPVPAEGGLKINSFSNILKKLKKEFNVAGVCLLGYTAMNNQKISILQEIIDLGRSLK